MNKIPSKFQGMGTVIFLVLALTLLSACSSTGTSTQNDNKGEDRVAAKVDHSTSAVIRNRNRY